MRSPADSGFGWNDDVKCIIAKRDVFDHWVRTHPIAEGLLNKPFLHYDALSYVFEKDRATKARVKTFADISLNVSASYDSVPTEDGLDMEFPAMCNPRINMSPKDIMGEWPEKAMSREDAMAAQVIELIEAILNLTMAEKSNCVVLVNQKVSLMRSFIKMSDSMKAAYCRILLGGDS
ncbi:retrotransposon protein [Cucumis melo var. makuwa]|uniref:Retrotransposon protein n=1 Tax=Cucumis melo var. makuwa TaxID=1194695 RepID=A0A5A7T479_CUCMM|nr:retrotransposon protein [Cucumis melo var. makuwa]